MKIFIDTADLDEIREIASWGIIDGATTNPTLVKKSGRSFEEIINLIIKKQVVEIEKKIGTYWQFIFDLAKTVPVSYLENGPLDINNDNHILENIVKDIEGYNFTVKFDGITIKEALHFLDLNQGGWKVKV